MKVLGKIPGWLVRSLLIAVGLTLVGVSGWYGPLVTASLWRVFHPRGRVVYRGLHVQVPWPWIADTEGREEDATAVPEGLVLRKMPQTLFHRPAPQSIFVTVISGDPETTPKQQTDQWMTTFRESHQGFEFSGPAEKLPTGRSCLRATLPTRPDRVVWTCISVNEGWVASLEGRRSEEPAFFEIVEGLTR